MDQAFEFQAEICRVLGHPKRLEILRCLADGPVEVSGLLARVGLTPSGLSQHLAVMRTAGIVERIRGGPAVQYRLTDPDFVTACRIMRGAIQRRMARMAELSVEVEVESTRSAPAEAGREPEPQRRLAAAEGA